MAHFLMTVWFDEDYGDLDTESADEQRKAAQVSALNEEMIEAGVWVFAGGLQPTTSATVLRSAATGVSMTDGPYAETKEQMAGFWVIDAPDFDAALDWAGRATAACEQPIEVRPFHDAPA
ncbi:YciI family protein [Aquihabitans sp. McL0605]|uniref:YciI family protein n=1 Tax=Aquihabitans sp. McL0605 TaxID=3415671 RepID=UPI003CF563E4